MNQFAGHAYGQQCVAPDGCGPVDPGALQRRIEQLERRVDGLEKVAVVRSSMQAAGLSPQARAALKGLARTPHDIMPIPDDPKPQRTSVTLCKNLGDYGLGNATFVIVAIDVANALLTDGWRLADV